MSALLSVSGLSVAYGGIQAVRDLSLEVASGEMVCLIGANGAGKTTTLKAISGLIAAQAGSVAVRVLPSPVSISAIMPFSMIHPPRS